MTLGAPGETYDIPQDPEERKRHLMRAGEITTRHANEKRTFSREKDKAHRQLIDADYPELKPTSEPRITRESNELRTFGPDKDISS